VTGGDNRHENFDSFALHVVRQFLVIGQISLSLTRNANTRIRLDCRSPLGCRARHILMPANAPILADARASKREPQEVAMKRRTFLIGSAAAAAGMPACPALSQSPPAAGQPLAPTELQSAIARLRKQFMTSFDPIYVENVIVPHFLVSTYQGERLSLPMIDVKLTKENALPSDLWGLISESWRPSPEDGVTVFLQGLEKRGPDNRRKRIYMSAVTPDLYRPMYSDKVMQFFDKLLDDKNAGKPLMRPYLEGYFDMYWDLHLGVKGDAIPKQVRQIGESFNTVLAYRDPTQKIVYDNYMGVRSNLGFLKSWIDERIADLANGKTPDPQKTFAYYWMKNGGNGDDFKLKDVVFECFHNFVAFSQWGNTMYNIMLKLGKNTGDPDARAWFKRTMESSFDQKDGNAFTPLERFVMELFRTITPNGGSISALEEVRTPQVARHGYIISPHKETSFDQRHWKNPDKFDPTRYNDVPTSNQIDEAKAQQIGFARCPFERTSFEVKDGRKAVLHNSGFGTVYGIVDGTALPVCDYAGFAPFGFGYRRCPGEQLTIQVFEDFLRKVKKNGIEFEKLDIANPEPLPIGPTTVIGDNVGFTRAA
jgi:cytochrome P450